ncbi:MAG TPA: alanyl-tRNA editing protein [Candidatus Thermoplasmatota archaeon]|nr:alanyl-tRNA editing protein [Candidatus Thermoplasmatota archaeon]
MTDLLWMPPFDPLTAPPGSTNPNYVKEFRGKVLKALDDWVLFDRTAFYAEGGGQPSDQGKIWWDGGEARVKHVSKKGAVKHVVEGDKIPEGVEVRGVIDWDLRYKHMRMHTAQHVLSGLAFAMYNAKSAGNQLHADYSRIDLEPPAGVTMDLSHLEAEVNRVLSEPHPVRTYEEDRKVIEARDKGRSLMHLVPQSVNRLRVVEIVDADYCPCAGTHVADTREIGRFKITGTENKGAGKTRIIFELS